MNELDKHKLHNMRSLKELSYMKYILEYEVTISEKAIVSSVKGIKFTLIESAKQTFQDYTKRVLQMALVALFNKIRHRNDDSETEE